MKWHDEWKGTTAEINDTIDALGGREHVLGCVFNNARKGNAGGATSEYGYGYGGHYAK